MDQDGASDDESEVEVKASPAEIIASRLMFQGGMSLEEVGKLTLNQAYRLLYLLDVNRRAKNRNDLALSVLPNADKKTSERIWKAIG